MLMIDYRFIWLVRGRLIQKPETDCKLKPVSIDRRALFRDDPSNIDDDSLLRNPLANPGPPVWSSLSAGADRWGANCSPL